MSNFILEAKCMSKYFYDIPAVENVDFYLEPGTIHGLIGENGAGKSTLVKMLSGAKSIDKGEIFIEGRKAEIRSINDAYGYGIRMIYQEFRGVPYLTVMENIFLGREEYLGPRYIKWLGLLDNRRMTADAYEIMHRMSIDHISPGAILEALSRADQQLVEIFKGISLAGKIYIFDEPTASLSAEEVKRLFQVLRQLKNQGCAIVYISHRLEEIMEITDFITILRNAKCVVSNMSTKKVNMGFLVEKLLGVEKIIQNDHVEKQDNVTILSAREFRFKDKRREVIAHPVILEIRDLFLEGKLKNINIDFRSGEVLGIVGLLGSGRTELVETLFGITPYSSGSLTYNGKPINIDSPIKAARMGIALLTENRKDSGLFLELPIELNILVTNLRKTKKRGMISRKRCRQLAQQEMNKLGIVPIEEKRLAKYLSGGNQQKVVIAKWLFKDAEIIMLDEPMAGIDIKTKFEICKLIDQLAAANKAIVVISSELEILLGISDRVILLSKGTVVGESNSDSEEDYRKIQAMISKL